MSDSRLLANPELLAEVGRATATRLRTAGVTTLAELIAADASVAPAAGSEERLRRWQAAALLLTLDDMTPTLAAALVKRGVETAAELADRGLRTIEDIADAAESDPPSVYALAALQVQACRRSSAGLLAVRVLNAAGKPLNGALVRVAGQRDETGRKGWSAFDAVPEGPQLVEVQPQGLLVPYGLGVTIERGRLHGPLEFRVPAKRDGPLANRVHRQSEGALVTNRHVTATRIQTVPLSDIRRGCYLVVRPALASGRVPLVSLDKVRAGLELQITRTVVDTTELPAGAQERSLVQYIDGALILTDKTPGEVTSSWAKPVVRQVKTISP